MALIFNDYARQNLLRSWMTNATVFSYDGFQGYRCALYIYPNTVSYPTNALPGYTINNGQPSIAGYICVITINWPSSYLSYNSVNSSISMSTSLTGTATGSGTVGWVWFYSGNSYYDGQFATNSVGLPGSNSVITLSTLTLTSGSPVTWSAFNLKIL